MSWQREKRDFWVRSLYSWKYDLRLQECLRVPHCILMSHLSSISTPVYLDDQIALRTRRLLFVLNKLKPQQ